MIKITKAVTMTNDSEFVGRKLRELISVNLKLIEQDAMNAPDHFLYSGTMGFKIKKTGHETQITVTGSGEYFKWRPKHSWAAKNDAYQVLG